MNLCDTWQDAFAVASYWVGLINPWVSIEPLFKPFQHSHALMQNGDNARRFSLWMDIEDVMMFAPAHQDLRSAV
jgi:hypothetical protein